jgi:hypothetical protein
VIRKEAEEEFVGGVAGEVGCHVMKAQMGGGTPNGLQTQLPKA